MKIRIPLDKLEPGFITDQDIYSGSNLLLAKGSTVTVSLVATMRLRKLEYVEVSETSKLAKLLDDSEQPDSLTKIMLNAKEIHEQHNLQTAVPVEMLEEATDELQGFFKEIEMGIQADPNKMRPMVGLIVGELAKNPGAAIKLLDLDRFDRYTYRHSLNVGLLYAMVAQDWCDSEEDLTDQVFGAVMHDLGKAKVGNEIINKQGKLTREEWEIIQLHPIWSCEMLEAVEANPKIISIARSHHEKLNGTGYPDGLAGDEINKYARLAAVADVYDALTTKRSYKIKMDFGKAINIIIGDCGSHFDPQIAHLFIKRVGRYPLGTFVKLSTGAVAIVVKVNEHAVNCPVVSRVLDPGGVELDQAEELDLSQTPDLTVTSIVVSPEEVSE